MCGWDAGMRSTTPKGSTGGSNCLCLWATRPRLPSRWPPSDTFNQVSVVSGTNEGGDSMLMVPLVVGVAVLAIAVLKWPRSTSPTRVGVMVVGIVLLGIGVAPVVGTGVAVLGVLAGIAIAGAEYGLYRVLWARRSPKG